MRTSKNDVNIRKLKSSESTFQKSNTDNVVTKIRDLILTAIEVCKRSRVPILFMSNPGYGKTTNVESYARSMGYHVESLIGSQYSQDEILGFQVRTNKSHLEILEPEWYHRIIAYSKPHYETKSSGSSFNLVEDDDVEKTRNELNSFTSELSKLNEDLKKYEAELESSTDKELTQVNINTIKIEISRTEARIKECKDLLNDIQFVGPRPSILFLDELSTASLSVQGALLHLCFAREIRGNKKLPDDCVLLSAANYKRNLPGHVDINSPSLNRFCILNVLPGDVDTQVGTSESEQIGFDLIDEFLQDFSEIDYPIKKFKEDFVMNKETQSLFLKDFRDGMKQIIRNHTNIDTSKLNLDFRNINFEDVYDRSDEIPEVYNFISPRTLSYFARLVRSLCEMGITSKDKDIYYKLIDGLMGLGTNSFPEQDEEAFKAMIMDYHKSLHYFVDELLIKYTKNITSVTGTARKIEDSTELEDDKTITGYVKSIIRKHDSGEKIDKDILNQTILMIKNSFTLNLANTNAEDEIKKFSSFKDNVDKMLQFRSDYESVIQLVSLLELYENKDIVGIGQIINVLKRDVIDAYKFYYTFCC